MTAFGVIPRHRRPEPASLGWVVARIDRQGRADLTSASVYELREDAEHTRDQVAAGGYASWSYVVAEVVPVPP